MSKALPLGIGGGWSIIGPMSLEHWKYFTALEHDLHTIARYVEPAPANYGTFSVELTKLFLNSCSEVEVVCKLLCARDAPGSPAHKMDDYRSALHLKYPQLNAGKVETPGFGITLVPWSTWGSGANPSWWGEHNDVKHSRHMHFNLANLGNALHAMAGLYLLLHRYYLAELRRGKLMRNDAFFECDGEPARVISNCQIT
jgi:hypothetical protein